MTRKKPPRTPKTPSPPKPTALIRVPAAPLEPKPVVLEGQVVPLAATTDPFTQFIASCDEHSKATMRARLAVAARILHPGGERHPDATAERYPWWTLDHIAVTHVLDKLKTRKGEPASPATKNLTRAALRKMAKVLFNLRVLDVDERQRINDVRPARGKRLPPGRALTPRELRKLFKACERDATAAGRRDAALLAVLFGGGLRRDEVSKLDLADVDPAGSLRVQGKGNVERQQPIVPEVVHALQAWLEVRRIVRGEDAKALFVTIDKFGRVGQRRLDGKAIAWKIVRRAKEAGIERLADGHLVSPHDFRRSFGTGLLEAGEDLATVAKAMRHASVVTTALYDRRDERQVAKAVARLVVPFGR